MKIREEKIGEIRERLDKKKFKKFKYGIGIGIGAETAGAMVTKDKIQLFTIEELAQAIEELTMLKESIEETTGIILYEMLNGEHYDKQF